MWSSFDNKSKSSSKSSQSPFKLNNYPHASVKPQIKQKKFYHLNLEHDESGNKD